SCVFQAEDGLRGLHVTGVQTCALPIFTGGWLDVGKASEAGEAPSDGMPGESRGNVPVDVRPPLKAPQPAESNPQSLRMDCPHAPDRTSVVEGRSRRVRGGRGRHRRAVA